MSVNGVTSQVQAAAYHYPNTEKSKENDTKQNTEVGNSTVKDGVVYEPSQKEETSSTKKIYKPNTELVNKLKADAEARTEQLRSLVEKIISGQADAYGNAYDIWSFLREGNFTVDPATKLKAQEDISEDGYWGVAKTSERILDFAKALTGGDPDKIEEMRDAFKKGYEQAEKIWGGKLPEISQQTYDAVMKGFDDMAAEKTTE